MTTEATAATAAPATAKVDSAASKRRLSRSVAADLVAIGDILAMMLGGLLPALIYALAGNISIDQVLVTTGRRVEFAHDET